MKSPDPTSPPPSPDFAVNAPDFPLVWGASGLARAVPAATPWLWQGYLAPGATTLLTSQWKSGKTTLTSVLLAKLKTGSELAGLPLAAGRALVLSEESLEQWQRRSRQLDFGDHIGWVCRPFKARPTQAEWLTLLDRVVALHARFPLSLVVIDPLAAFLPARSENDAGSMLAALMPLQRLTSEGLSVLAHHHPRRAKSPAGTAARGSGALPGYVDILIEMRYFRRATDNDRRRRLIALSRFPGTPRQRVIEWTADGTDYVSHGTFAEEEFHRTWATLRVILENAPRKLRRSEIHKAWPASPAPDLTTVITGLEKAVAANLVRRDGKGLRSAPYRYWLPGQEAAWSQDPLALLHMPELYVAPPQSEYGTEPDAACRPPE